MIPILYDQSETEFNSNGIGALSDTISCTVEEELNGLYELELKYPLDGIHFPKIGDRSIILAKPNPVSDPQPFRVYNHAKLSKGTITVFARHVAYDAKGVPVSPFTATSVASALQGIKVNAAVPCPFDFWTDKGSGGTMQVKVPSDVWSLLGGSEGSVLGCFGGEYEFDRWTIKLHTRRGANRGVSIRYGKNLKTLEQDRNCANCYTGVYPYWASEDGDLVVLPEKIIYADGDFDYSRILPLNLSLEWEEAPTEEALRARTKKYITDNEIGVPTVSWKVEFVQLEQTEEYKGKALLERVLLGDTVAVEFPKLEVSASARAVKAKFDSIKERYDSVTLGKVKANIANTIVQQQREIDQKPSVYHMTRAFEQLADRIMGVKGGAVRLLDTNGDGEPDELYIADNRDPALATKVWRFNYEGWAVSKTGYNGPYIMGATLDDGLLAEFVTAAKLVAGTIQSADGETFFLDLDNGVLSIRAVSEAQESITHNSAAINVLSDSIDSTVERYQQDMDSVDQQISTLRQTADGISISVQKIQEDGVGKVTTTGKQFTLDDSGLHIADPGGEMENLLNETGMYVKRGSTVMLQANEDGVIATDVSVRNYLVVGDYSRLEDYNNGTDEKRTACFHLGG